MSVDPRARPRIASLVPSLTELVVAIGLRDCLVARTGFCVHPSEALAAVPKVGGTKTVNLQKLRRLAPTHVVVNVDENTWPTVEALQAFVPHVLVTHPLSPQDNLALIDQLAAGFPGDGPWQTPLQAQAAAWKRRIADELALTQPHGRPPSRVLYLIWRGPWMTVSRDTYVSATLARAGLDTLPGHAAKRYPAIGDDDPAWRDADRILMSTEPYAFRERDRASLARSTGKRVDLIDGEWTSWYGSRAIEGLAALARYRAALRA